MLALDLDLAVYLEASSQRMEAICHSRGRIRRYPDCIASITSRTVSLRKSLMTEEAASELL